MPVVCVVMLIHGSNTWPVAEDHEVNLFWTEKNAQMSLWF